MALTHCPNCGYSLRGHTGSTIRCPEYGQLAIDRFEGVQFHESDQTIVGLICGGIFLACAGVVIIAWTPAGLGIAGVGLVGAAAGALWARRAAGRWDVVGALVTSWLWIVMALTAVTAAAAALRSSRSLLALPGFVRLLAAGVTWASVLFLVLRGRKGLFMRWLNAAFELMRTIAVRR